MSLETEIRKELTNRGAAFVYFVDVSHLPEQQTKGLSSAILFGIPLTPEFIQEVANKYDYIQELIQNNRQDEDEFSLKEIAADQMADDLANYLQTKGYPVYSQSEKNLIANGCYDAGTHSTVLPHKTIAGLAGLGWIGKNNLLVTPEYGSAISICTLLTTAPLPAVLHPAGNPKCGACTICKDICPTGAIKGKNWDRNSPRDERIDVYTCTTCLKCLAHCPWTQSYAKNNFLLPK
jgi:epoxyqueuosine reductase QueG